MEKIENRTKMTPEQFVYWLQGFFEISNAEALSRLQTEIVKDHLALVFRKMTPDYSVFEKKTDCADGIDYIPFNKISPSTAIPQSPSILIC